MGAATELMLMMRPLLWARSVGSTACMQRSAPNTLTLKSACAVSGGVLSTGPEILEDAGKGIDAFVACVGSGGTLTGVGGYLKKAIPGLSVFAVEPAESPLLSGGRPGAHGIEGIGANFVPGVLDTSLFDEVLTVKTDDAILTARKLARCEGLLCGISSGAAVSAAAALAKRNAWRGKTIVTVLPDTGERYLSTKLFQ